MVWIQSHLSVLFNSTCEFFQCRLNVSFWRTDVQSHETFSTRPEHLTVVEGKMRLVDEQIEQGIVTKAQPLAVEPHQEACLWTNGLDLRHTLTTEVLDEADIVFHGGKHLPAPFTTLTESSNGGYMGEDMRLVKFVSLQPAKEALADVWIGHYGMRRHDSRYIECLCGSLHGDADLCGLLRDRSERYVLVSEKGHVAMYLIADDKHVVVVAEIRKANERLTTPTYSARVVRITQDKYSAFVITNSLKTLKVHLIIVASLHVVGLKRL